MLPRFGRAFESIVARRMAVLFFVCTIVPVTVFALLSVRGTIEALEARARRTLHFEARALGQEALGRLDLLSRTLNMLATDVLAGKLEPTSMSARLQSLFDRVPEAIVVLPGSGPSVVLRGRSFTPDLTTSQRIHLQDWGRILTTAPEFPGRLVLLVGSSSGTASGLVGMVIDEARLFGLDEDDSLPPDSAACVFSGSRPLTCSASVPAEILEQIALSAGDGDLTLDSSAGTYLVRMWTLTMRAQYGAPPWAIAIMRPRAVVRAPTDAFVWNFGLMATLLALIIGWVTLVQVRRILKPLDALTAATARMAAHRFDQPVVVSSADEFETLASAFNDLAARLKRQFADLEAFNLGTLSALARTIDAKSPWTGGHSERVTALAHAIAAEMGLPTDEIDALRRGGLVHDIGKLATPQEILDKAGRLTDDEQAVIERHPDQGVRILEPIPAFGPLLPIVAQHHERWDGEGYPRGLVGEQIARTARVLSVADVYDALRSDRPYRRGLAHDRVVEFIVSGAGRQFDPAVVEAFLTLAPTIQAREDYPVCHGDNEEAPRAARPATTETSLAPERD
jgi:putative nucleotidyltransferase with HDIG domain